jgi:hypothetical protein
VTEIKLNLLWHRHPHFRFRENVWASLTQVLGCTQPIFPASCFLALRYCPVTLCSSRLSRCTSLGSTLANHMASSTLPVNRMPKEVKHCNNDPQESFTAHTRWEVRRPSFQILLVNIAPRSGSTLMSKSGNFAVLPKIRC